MGTKEELKALLSEYLDALCLKAATEVDDVNTSSLRRLPEKYRNMTVQEAFSYHPDENDDDIPVMRLDNTNASMQDTAKSVADKKAEDIQKRLQEMLKKQAEFDRVESELKNLSQN